MEFFEKIAKKLKISDDEQSEINKLQSLIDKVTNNPYRGKQLLVQKNYQEQLRRAEEAKKRLKVIRDTISKRRLSIFFWWMK